MTFSEGNVSGFGENHLPLEQDIVGVQIRRLSFPDFYENYIFHTRKPETTIGQIISLYRNEYGSPPWNEHHSPSEVLGKMHNELMPQRSEFIRQDPFLFIAEEEGKVIGFTWGFVTDDAIGLPQWVAPKTQDRQKKIQVTTNIRDAIRDAGLVQSDHRIAVIAEMVVSQEAGRSRGGVVFGRLARAMVTHLIEDVHVVPAVGWTVRQKDNKQGPSPRMAQLTELFGWNTLYNLGSLPTNPEVDAHIVAGNLREALENLDNPTHIVRTLLRLRRRQKEKQNNVN